MSHLDDSLDELDEVMSYVSTTFSEVDAPSLSPGQCPGTPKLPVGENVLVEEAKKEWRHPKFYLSDFVDIQVESMLYRVPRALMQQSDILKSNLPTNQSSSLYVSDITAQEMEAFLDVWDARAITGDEHFTFEQWAGALVTADRLKIPRIRSYVTQRLQDSLNQLDPFDCIDVATKYRVHEWLFQPFLRICERAESLSPVEVLRLGSERSSAVCRVREKLSAHKYESVITWVTNRWPKGGGFGARPPLQWEAMTKPLGEGQAVEAKRLVELETVLSKPNFPSPPAQSTVEPLPQGMPHPKYWQTDLRTMKVRNCLYQLPIRYFEQPTLLGEIQSHRDSSAAGDDLVMLPHDVVVSEWNIFLDIVTARPFDDPLLSLGFSSWMTGLRLAIRFGHNGARSYILKRIQTDFPEQDPIDLLEAAKIGDETHSDWLQGLYESLSQRKGPLSAEDIRRIGEEAAAEVWKLRDRYMWNAGQDGRDEVF